MPIATYPRFFCIYCDNCVNNSANCRKKPHPAARTEGEKNKKSWNGLNTAVTLHHRKIKNRNKNSINN